MTMESGCHCASSKLVGFFHSKQISDLCEGARDFSVALPVSLTSWPIVYTDFRPSIVDSYCSSVL